MSGPSTAVGAIGSAENRALQSVRRKALEALRRQDPSLFASTLEKARRQGDQQSIDEALTAYRAISPDGSVSVDLKVSDLDARTKTELGKLQDASEQLEAVMVKQMLSLMRRSIPKSPLDGPMGDLAHDMFDQTMSEQLAKAGSVGIAPLLFNQLSQRLLQQEAAEAVRATMPIGVDDSTDR